VKIFFKKGETWKKKLGRFLKLNPGCGLLYPAFLNNPPIFKKLRKKPFRIGRALNNNAQKDLNLKEDQRIWIKPGKIGNPRVPWFPLVWGNQTLRKEGKCQNPCVRPTNRNGTQLKEECPILERNLPLF